MELFTLLVYQPFLNILVFIYWILEQLTHEADMGIAVIIFTVVVRFLMLPLSLKADRSEADRREIVRKISEIEQHYKADPIALEREKKRVLRTNHAVLVSELISLTIQVIIALMLWKMFSSGLGGDDFHLVYSFMPDVTTPFNLVFLGRYDLTHPHLLLNFIQSVLIFIMETLAVYYSPYKVTRGEVIRLQFFLPVVAFIIFMGLPAGKKLFVITSLLFSIVLLIIKIIRRTFLNYSEKFTQKQNEPEEEKVLVTTK